MLQSFMTAARLSSCLQWMRTLADLGNLKLTAWETKLLDRVHIPSVARKAA